MSEPLSPFGFHPALDVAVYCVARNEVSLQIGQPGGDVGDDGTFTGLVTLHHSTAAAGFAGDDEFTPTVRCLNGWRVAQVELRTHSGRDAGFMRPANNLDNGAYVVDWRPGSDSPDVKVRWWMDGVFPVVAHNAISYRVAITVTGPKGLPYR